MNTHPPNGLPSRQRAGMAMASSSAQGPEAVFGACDADPDVTIAAMGLRLWVRLPPALFDGAASVIETAHAPGAGPPLHRHREAETFRVLQGRYLMQRGTQQFEVGEGEVVHVPGGMPHAFVNIGDGEARQLVLISPGMQADVFFRQLAALMAPGYPSPTRLRAFGQPWGVEFLGPPLHAARHAGEGAEPQAIVRPAHPQG